MRISPRPTLRPLFDQNPSDGGRGVRAESVWGNDDAGARWVESAAGFRVPAHLAGYVDTKLASQAESIARAAPPDESADPLLAALFITEIGRSLRAGFFKLVKAVDRATGRSASASSG
jgi:hypothetical protein